MSELDEYRFVKTNWGIRLAWICYDPEGGPVEIRYVPSDRFIQEPQDLIDQIVAARTKPIIDWPNRNPEPKSPERKA